jgi:hypothetical protein
MEKTVELKFPLMSLDETGARLGISRSRQREILALFEQPGNGSSSKNGYVRKRRVVAKKAMPKKRR